MSPVDETMMPDHGIDLVVAVDLEREHFARAVFSDAVGRHTMPLKRIGIEPSRIQR
jgi:hypothetical protein